MPIGSAPWKGRAEWPAHASPAPIGRAGPTMRDWGFSPSPEDLEAVTAAARVYRDGWASIRPPFPAAFDGSIVDVRALDYINYEGIDVPGGGIGPAAMVCGEVLRRA